MITILNRWTRAVLYSSETATTIAQAVIEAHTNKADLRGADLRGADLSDAVLRGADLRGAVLSDADLSGADLRGAVLSDGSKIIAQMQVIGVAEWGAITFLLTDKGLRVICGCRDMPFAEARKHWADRDDRACTRLCLDWAEAWAVTQIKVAEAK